MILKWVDSVKCIRIDFTDGSYLEFQANLWNRTGLDKDVYDSALDAPMPGDIFKSYNLWWATQSVEKEMRAKELYTTAIEIFSEELSADAINRALHSTVEELVKLHDWCSFRRFYVEDVKLNFDVYKKEKLEANDTSIDTTYFTEPSIDLVVFSILIKGLMPLWGLYYYYYKGKLGSEFAMLYSIYMVKTDMLVDNPAWVKLETLVSSVAGKAIKANHSYSITNDIGSEEQTELILSLILLKKVCNFDPLVVGDSIVRKMYALLRDRCDRISRGGPKNRNMYNRTGDALSVVDTYNIIKLQPPAVEVAVTYYVKYTAEALGIPGNRNEIDRIVKSLAYLKDQNFHYQILTMVVGDILGGRNLLLLRKDSLLELLAMSSIWLKKHGKLALSELLICIPTEKDINTISFSSQAQTPLPSDLQSQLAEIYKWVYPRTPAEDLITDIIRTVNSYDYKFVEGKLCNIQIELAEMLIYHNHAMKRLVEITNNA